MRNTPLSLPARAALTDVPAALPTGSEAALEPKSAATSGRTDQAQCAPPHVAATAADSADVHDAGRITTAAPSHSVAGSAEPAEPISLPRVPPLRISEETHAGALAFANNMRAVLSGFSEAVQRVTALDSPRALSARELTSSDEILTEFIKLQLTDPNNSVETHMQLHTILSECRKLAIEEARVRREKAHELKRKAEKKAGWFGKVFKAASIVVSVVGIVAACAVPGGAALLIGALAAATTLAQGIANYSVHQVMIEAARYMLKALRWEHEANECQRQIEEEAEMIKLILEAKNAAVDAIFAMRTAAHASRMKPLAAGFKY